MLTKKAARGDRNKLPALGAIVIVKIERALNAGHRWRRFRVIAYPLLFMTPGKYSTGIRMTHCVIVEALDNRKHFTVAGFYCEEIG